MINQYAFYDTLRTAHDPPLVPDRATVLISPVFVLYLDRLLSANLIWTCKLTFSLLPMLKN